MGRHVIFRQVLIANRGEIAIRIAAGAADLGIRSVAVFASDDARALHPRRADEARALAQRGAAAYLNIDALLAQAQDCDCVHPGYGFLSESGAFARRVAGAGLRFIGPAAETLELFGDKAKAKALAGTLGIPVLAGTTSETNLAEAQTFFAALPAGHGIVIKAIAGGGGRGMRIVRRSSEIVDAFARCESEARAAFGDGRLYIEALAEGVRHIEIQLAADQAGNVMPLGERECTLQRRGQKLVELAPSPSLAEPLRKRITEAAVALGRAAKLTNLCTVEFLVADSGHYWFIEANPRLQVEHTVTEAVTGLDLVQLQFRLADGARLKAVGLGTQPPVRGFAVQARVNMETMDTGGHVHPSAGRLNQFDPPTGPGIRVDSFGYAGFEPSPRYDSLLAKLIVQAQSYDDTLRKAYRALCAFRIEGIATNLPFLKNLLTHPLVRQNAVHTAFVEAHASVLAGPHDGPQFYVENDGRAADTILTSFEADETAIVAPTLGRVVSLGASEGAFVRQGAELAILDSMKMEFVVEAPYSGIVRAIAVTPDDIVAVGQPIMFVDPQSDHSQAPDQLRPDVSDDPRTDLREIMSLHGALTDQARAEASAKRHSKDRRTIRENINDLCDPQSFTEYGALAIAAQRQRWSKDELRRLSPADGLIAGIGRVNGSLFDTHWVNCAVLGYDYTVFAGTQGVTGHKKKDRLFALAEKHRLPVVLFAEGGGGRPAEFDLQGVAGFDGPTFWQFPRLSGLVPLVGLASGRCFAGNAALYGCCDVTIATRDSSIGMAGPAMIEGGGLGIVDADKVGPVSVQSPNGVIDLVADDERHAVALAKQYLSYFQGSLSDWRAGDPTQLRNLVPENRLRAYEIRPIIAAIADIGTVLELRPAFGIGMMTALIRVEGQPLGVIANNPKHLGGAIDAAAADKAARFIQLCDAFDIPLLSLCDTPGFMVGPDAEKTALVRHVSRLYVAAANAEVPLFTIILRKAYGLGAVAMAAGSFRVPSFVVSWPTGEFGPMGLEGSVRLAFRKELAAIEDPKAREAMFKDKVAKLYDHGKAANAAGYFEIDDVIDPAQTRHWIMQGLRLRPPTTARHGKKRSFVDSW